MLFRSIQDEGGTVPSIKKGVAWVREALKELENTPRVQMALQDLVIGADTVVVKDGKVLGKPKNREDAFTMLKGLSGSIHEVYTGVSLWMREDGKKVQYSFYECTKVTMYPVTDEELNRYIDTGEPMDKAGAYGIQGKAAAFIKKIEGDYNNVVGMPIARIYQELKQLGIDVYKFS